MERRIGLGARLVLAIFMLAVCVAGAAAAAAGAREIVVAQYTDIVSLDPQDTNDNPSYGVEKLIFEGLVGFDADMKVVPQLAERWEVSPDARRFTFYLRRGVQFHDGTPLDAEAVKCSFDRVRNPANKLRRYSLYAVIDKVEVVDRYTVRFTTSQPFSAMVATLAHPAGGIVSCAAVQKWGAEFYRHPVGTGPYRFVEWVPGDHVTVERNPLYWDAARGPKVDRIVVKPVPEAGTRIAMLLRGDAHFVNNIPPAQADLVRRSAQASLTQTESIYVFALYLNNQRAPFNDVRVRKALNLAVDKQGIIDSLYRGFARVADSVIAPKVWGYARQDAYAFDPAAARRLLAEAGYPNGFSTTLWVGDDSFARAVGEAIQGQLRNVGVKVEVVPMEAGVRTAEMFKPLAETRLEMAYSGWSPSTGDADWGIRPLLTKANWPPANFGIAFYTNDQVERLVQQALETADEQKRAALYAQAQRLIWNDAPWVFLWTPVLLGGIRNDVTGMTIQPDGIAYLRDAAFKP